MLKEGQIIYFLMNGYVMSGKVMDIEKLENDYEFSIEGYAGCSGPHRISSRQIHMNIFLDEKEAQQYIDNPQMYLPSYC